MGQPVTFIRSNSPRPGVVRLELNRSLTGMGHEHYVAGQTIQGDRPPDVLAKRIFELGNVASIHIYSSMLTITLATTEQRDLEQVVSGLFTYYVPGVEIPDDEELMAMV